jgi:hypothetical protein
VLIVVSAQAAFENFMVHIVLLGDSVFDNAAYVGGGPDVVRQLRTLLAGTDSATLCAVDGHVTSNVAEQLRNVPRDATHLIVSVGGNDALLNMAVLDEGAANLAAALERLSDVAAEFRQGYRAMLASLEQRDLPTAISTIYDPRFPNYRLQRLATAALALFNNVILREAAERGWPVLDMRLICNEDRDYANPIEPSVSGGEKIAWTIARLVRSHDFARRTTEIYVRP